MQELLSSTFSILGDVESDLTATNMAVRAFCVYLFAIALVRIGEQRFLGKYSALDIILGFILGSILSRAITSTPFFPTLLAGAVVVGMHWLFSVLAFRYSGFGKVVKGRDLIVVQDGEVVWESLRTSHLSMNDLLGAIRSQAHTSNIHDIKEARLERNGKISVIKKNPDKNYDEEDDHQLG